MADIATLGIAVNSSGLKTGANDLRAFESVAKRTGETVEQVQKRFAALNPTAAATAAHVKGMTTAVAPANEQLVRLAATSEKTNTAVTRLFNLTIGQVAMRATRELVSYGWNLNKVLADAADTADRAGISFQKFQGLGTSAAYKGVSSNDFNAGMLAFNQQVDLAKNGLGSLAGLLRANGQTVGDTATTFAKVADMVRNAASEAQKFSILQQVGLPASREFVKFMEQGAAAISKQADEAKKLTDQQVNDARRVDEEFNKAWTDIERSGKSAFVSVFDFVRGQTRSFVEDTKREWQSLKQFAQDLRNGFTSSPQAGPKGVAAPTVAPWMRDMAAGNIDWSKAAGGYRDGVDGSFGGRKTIDPELLKQQIGLQQQYLALVGQISTADEARLAVEKQLQIAGLNGVSIGKERANVLKQIAYEGALGITQTKAQTDALNVEAATIGMTVGQAASYVAVQTKINEELRKGNQLRPDQIDQMQREADVMGQAAQRVDALRSAYSTGQSFFTNFMQSVRQGKGPWESFASAATSALDRISDKLAQMAFDNLWKNAFGGAGGGMGGFFANLFGGGGGAAPTVGGTDLGAGTGGHIYPAYHTGGVVGLDRVAGRYVHSVHFDDAPRYHSGLMPSEFPAILQRGEGVFTKNQMAALGQRSGSGAVTVNVHNAPAGTTARAETSRDEQGNTRIDVMLDQTMAQKLADPGSASRRANDSYGRLAIR